MASNMTRTLYTFLFLSCVLTTITARLSAQQNLFNIPSGDITPAKKWFYQHQFNVYSNKLESKGHFVYGLGKGWDAGVNLVGKGAYFSPEWQALYNSDERKGAVYPVLMFTGQKQWRLSDKVAVNLGTQVGANLSSSLRKKELNYFHYGLTAIQPKPWLKLVGGAYYSNAMFLGAGNRAGAMLGFEAHVWNGVYVMGDWMSGNNDAGVGVIGGMYQVSKRFQLCGGYALPNPRTPKPRAVVVELNFYGWDFVHPHPEEEPGDEAHHD